MARQVARGDIWLYQFAPPDKTRPVVILTRASVIPFLDTVTVAPVTSTIRGLPSEVLVGTDEGLKGPSAINLDHIQTVPKARLHQYIGRLDESKRSALCDSLSIALGCPSQWQHGRGSAAL